MRVEFIVIFITCASKKEALRIQDALLTKRLIVCANIITDIESRFWWHGKIDNADEVLLMAKTKEKNFKPIEYEVKHIHSYEVPEIIAFPIVCGSKDYLKWVDEESW